jgi:hypothetical protein
MFSTASEPMSCASPPANSPRAGVLEACDARRGHAVHRERPRALQHREHQRRPHLQPRWFARPAPPTRPRRQRHRKSQLAPSRQRNARDQREGASNVRTRNRCASRATPSRHDGSRGRARDNIRDNIHSVQPVHYVQKFSQFGRFGRPSKHLHDPNTVEGLVDFMVRGGSSPLGRTGKAPHSGAFYVLGRSGRPLAVRVVAERRDSDDQARARECTRRPRRQAPADRAGRARAEIRHTKATFAGHWDRWPAQRRPYLEPGTWTV